MNRFYKIISALCFLLSVASASFAVNVKVNADKGIKNKAVVATIERKLGALLSEINAAKEADRPLQLTGLGLSAGAQKTLNGLWVVSHFYCCDDEVTDRLWNFRKSYMVRSIPLMIAPDTEDSWAEGTYQEAVVEFDLNGNITDFRFSFSSRLGESFEKCSGSAVEVERKAQILAWCDRLATAYNEHNMAFMQKVFSDKALIITGRVVQVTNREFNTSNQKVIYSKQTKKQYLAKLQSCFRNNKFIKVEFDEVGIGDGGCSTVTQSNVNSDFYGVRLHQKYRSTNYSDDGYVFLLWNFKDDDAPQIEVRTWQPDKVDGKRIDQDDIFSIGDFENDLVDM